MTTSDPHDEPYRTSPDDPRTSRVLSTIDRLVPELLGLAAALRATISDDTPAPGEDLPDGREPAGPA